MNITLSTAEELSFATTKELKVGTMRVNFDNRYNGPLCNKWFPSSNIDTFLNNSLLDLKEIQQVVNVVQFETFNTFEKVVNYCKGIGYDYETFRCFQYGLCNYGIKLLPVVGDYNIYIFVYLKERLEE